MTPLIALAYFDDVLEDVAVVAAAILVEAGSDPKITRLERTAREIAVAKGKHRLGDFLATVEKPATFSRVHPRLRVLRGVEPEAEPTERRD